jgi:hypothetical protein
MRNATLVTCSLTIAGSLLTIARADDLSPDSRSRAAQPRAAAAARPEVRETAASTDAAVRKVAADYGCQKPEVASEAEAQGAPRQTDASKRIVFGP